MKTNFKSMALVGAALVSIMACYSVSLRVSAERAAVDSMRGKIAGDLQDIRTLQAELRTRARLPELQRWNEQVLALAPPKAEQFLNNSVMLASYETTTAPAKPAVQLAAIVRATVAAPMAAPSPIRQVSYMAPGPETGEVDEGVAAAPLAAVQPKTPAARETGVKEVGVKEAAKAKPRAAVVVARAEPKHGEPKVGPKADHRLDRVEVASSAPPRRAAPARAAAVRSADLGLDTAFAGAIDAAAAHERAGFQKVSMR